MPRPHDMTTAPVGLRRWLMVIGWTIAFPVVGAVAWTALIAVIAGAALRRTMRIALASRPRPPTRVRSAAAVGEVS